MRTDATVNKRQVKLPHLVPTLGYDRWIARPGDFILYHDGEPHETHLARVIGRVNAPQLPPPNGDREPIKGWLCVMAAQSGFDYPMERWVKPTNVVRVMDANHVRAFLSWFIRVDFGTLDATALRRYAGGEIRRDEVK